MIRRLLAGILLLAGSIAPPPTGGAEGAATKALILVEGSGAASVEAKLHLECYKQRDDVHAVIHAHPPKCIAFTLAAASAARPAATRVRNIGFLLLQVGRIIPAPVRRRALHGTSRDAAVRAEGDPDFRGTLGVAKDARVGFRDIRLHFDLETSAPAEQVANLLRLTERYCVVFQTLSNPPALPAGRAVTRSV